MKLNRVEAFTLMEILVWIAVIAIVVSLVGWYMVAVSDSVRGAGRAAGTAGNNLLIIESVTKDVRCSVRLLDEGSGRTAGPGVLILQQSDDTLVSYFVQKGVLKREVRRGDSVRTTSVASIGEIKFSWEKAGVATSRWVEVVLGGPKALGGRCRVYLMNTEGTL